jgi:hypothetical protein
MCISSSLLPVLSLLLCLGSMIMYGLGAMSIPVGWMMSAGVVYYWSINNAFSFAQSLLLKNKAFRDFIGCMPPPPAPVRARVCVCVCVCCCCVVCACACAVRACVSVSLYVCLSVRGVWMFMRLCVRLFVLCLFLPCARPSTSSPAARACVAKEVARSSPIYMYSDSPLAVHDDGGPTDV